MKKGIIDIGTNTFHLLIADTSSNNEVLHREKVAVRIGKDGISSGKIAEDAIERAVKTLLNFKSTMESYQVEEIITTATSAVRSAKNKNEFIEIIKKTSGIDIKVLSGEQEAFLIHQGVKAYQSFDETALIIDIGGGSIEFIIADQEKVRWLRSYEIGGQRLIDKFHKSDPISSSEKQNLTTFLKKTLSDVFSEVKKHNAKYLIGSSGSFDTFWDIFQNKEKDEERPKAFLSRDEFNTINQELIKKNKKDRLAIPGMIPMRVDMIVSASIVTDIIMKQCQFELIKVSSYALKEGILFFGLPSNN